MSKDRLLELLTSLQEYGWDIELGEEETFEELFVSDRDDILNWQLIRQSRKGNTTRIRLEFHHFGDLGNRSCDLNDILYCVIPSQGHKLFFAKKNTSEWRNNLKEFVEVVNRISQTQ